MVQEEAGDAENREIFGIYAQIQFGTNARGDYKYQFAQNIQRDIQLRDARNKRAHRGRRKDALMEKQREREREDAHTEFIKFTAVFLRAQQRNARRAVEDAGGLRARPFPPRNVRANSVRRVFSASSNTLTCAISPTRTYRLVRVDIFEFIYYTYIYICMYIFFARRVNGGNSRNVRWIQQR